MYFLVSRNTALAYPRNATAINARIVYPGSHLFTYYGSMPIELLVDHLVGGKKAEYGMPCSIVLDNPTNPYTDFDLRDAQTAVNALGLKLIVVKAAAESDFENAFATLVRERAGGLLIAGNLFFNDQRERLVALATREAIPIMLPWREAAVAGGLMSYGASIREAFRQSGVYASRILMGEKPADLPVQQSTKLELVINLKAAKALGLSFPLSCLAAPMR